LINEDGLRAVRDYHDGTKHHFNRFARSAGYLDWASQPNPFRSYAGAREFPLPRPGAGHVIGDLLRYSLGLSAWKQLGASRWSLRVNPSSGNLHPTEAYVVAAATPGLADSASVYHYAPDRHALEQRCAFDTGLAADRSASASAVSRLRRDREAFAPHPNQVWFVALTSIHWREAWKYGERAFRYCQHDFGHAIAAVRIAAALAGLSARILPDWSQTDIAELVGISRDADFFEAEREEAGCILEVTSHQSSLVSREALLDAVRAGRWTGRANQLSEDHVQWTFIDEIAAATRDPGRPQSSHPPAITQLPDYSITRLPERALLLQRRSAVALDGESSIDAERFFAMLSRVMPGGGAPWDALWWAARIHLVLFVHRVDGVAPGLYLLPRDPATAARLKAAMGREFLWEPVTGALPLVRLARGDCRRLAARVSCDQEIAADGFFSLGMLADFDASLEELGPSFYRHLFWESGVVGQILYLQAEAAGARGTGIGCFYDDPVHDILGLTDHQFQSLYHFTIGMPIEDTRLTTAPGYAWEG
jgi:SagB-type dehydrogenase family enzyme